MTEATFNFALFGACFGYLILTYPFDHDIPRGLKWAVIGWLVLTCAPLFLQCYSMLVDVFSLSFEGL